ncbi:MAG: translocation/assembly module TamB domain-containing protein, partial [Catalinimonas sp.]
DFVGFPTDFVANASFETPLGNIRSDVNLKISDDAANSYYRGAIATERLELGRLVGDQRLLQRLDMAGWIEGSGFLLSNAQDSVRAEVKRIGVRGYDYRNVSLNAYLTENLFRGTVRVDDPNLSLDLRGLVDLRRTPERVDVRGRIDSADLDALGYVPRLTHVAGDVNVDLIGLDLNALLGRADLYNLDVRYGPRALRLDSLRALSEETADGGRRVEVRSDLADVDVRGDFRIKQAAEDIAALVDEYGMIFRNDSLGLARHHDAKGGAPARYGLELDLRARDLNPLVRLFVPDFYLSAGVRAEGYFQHGYASLLTFETAFDTLRLGENTFYDVAADVSSSKIYDSTDVLASARITSGRQEIAGPTGTEDLYFEGSWNRRRIEFETGVEQTNSTNEARLEGSLAFKNNYSLLHFEPSHVRLLDREWLIDADNRITIWSLDSVRVAALNVSNGEQRLSADGVVSSRPTDSLAVRIKDFQLATLNGIITPELAGQVEADVTLRAVAARPLITGEWLVRDFVYEGFPLERIYGTAEWEEAAQRLKVDVDVSNDDLRVVRVAGFVRPDDEENQLSLTARFDGASLHFLEAIVPDISEVEGDIAGSVRVLGTFADPFVLGSLSVRDGQFEIDYLKTRYRFSDQVYFSENEISVSSLALVDEDGNRAVLSRGSLFHDGFTNFLVSLRGDLESFQVLNTTARDNPLYYGEVLATGSMEIFGPFESLSIRGDLRTERGTRLYIPVSDEESLASTSYVTFIDTDSTAGAGEVPADSGRVGQTTLQGLTLELNLEVTPDAYGEIIFDERSGDIIRANGEGTVKMVVDTRGDFNIFGQYTLTRGRYNFTLLNLINKEFVVQPGGSITWNGDPLKAQLSMNALYQQVTSFGPLVPPSERENIPNITRRYPVQVLLDLEGNLLSPLITLGIKVPENTYPGNLEPYVVQLRSLIQFDEQELNRQVFGLLVLRSLLQPNSFAGGGFQVGTAGAGGSLSELLSNQASYYLSRIDENLEIDIDLNGLDQDALNTLQLRLSYTAFDGRLRFTRDGSFTNADNQATASNIIGDITVEYSLTRDNRLRLKMFTRNNQNITGNLTLENNNNTTQGFSILHTQSFDRLRDLFPRGVREAKQEPDVDEPVVPDAEEEMPRPQAVGKGSGGE